MQENLLWVKKLSDTEFQNDVLIVAGAVISTARVLFVWAEFIYDRCIYIYIYVHIFKLLCREHSRLQLELCQLNN